MLPFNVSFIVPWLSILFLLKEYYPRIWRRYLAYKFRRKTKIASIGKMSHLIM